MDKMDEVLKLLHQIINMISPVSREPRVIVKTLKYSEDFVRNELNKHFIICPGKMTPKHVVRALTGLKASQLNIFFAEKGIQECRPYINGVQTRAWMGVAPRPQGKDI